jgi:hypothetical protein
MPLYCISRTHWLKYTEAFIIIFMDILNINPGLGLVVMMNNYFHDVATSLLMVSGIMLWIIYRRYHRHISKHGESDEVTTFFLNMYEAMTNVAKFSLIWILVGGIPRTLFYRSFEWSNAVAHAQIPALIAKHVLAFTFVGTGVFLWHKFNAQVKQIKKVRADKEAQ